MTSMLKLEIQYGFMAFIASLFRVTEEDCLSETDLSVPPSFSNVLLVLKELIFIYIFFVHTSLLNFQTFEFPVAGCLRLVTNTIAICDCDIVIPKGVVTLRTVVALDGHS